MAAPTKGPGSGLIKNPNPSRVDVVFYTVYYILGMVILWPLMLTAMVYVLLRDGPLICWGFLISHYNSCLFGD